MRAREIVAEAIPVKPRKPLTPAQSQKQSEKLVRLNQQAHDEDVRHAAKIRDLESHTP
jgi:hypothetical protein